MEQNKLCQCCALHSASKLHFIAEKIYVESDFGHSCRN